MSNSREMPAHDGAAPTALIFLVFLIAGPPIGGIALWFGGLMLQPAGSPAQMSFRSAQFISSLPALMLFSYLFGGLQAAITGIVAAKFYRRYARGWVPLIPVLLASIAMACLFAVLATWLGKTRLSDPKQLNTAVVGSLLALGVHVAAGIGSWAVANAMVWSPGRRID